jgi:hypothetical protein
MTTGTPDRPPRRQPEHKQGRLVRRPKPSFGSPASVRITELEDGAVVHRRSGGHTTFLGVVGPPPPRGQRRKR